MKISKEEKIESITDVAMEIFLEKGYQSTTMENIAKNAGLSKGGLYHYFKSKDMILICVNQKISTEIEKIMKNALKKSSVKEGLLSYIKNYLEYWLEHPKETNFLFLSITKIMENQELLKYYQEFTNDYIQYFQETFKMGVQSGEFIEHNVKTSAITLTAALDGIISYMILDDELKLDQIMKHFEEKFITPLESKP